MHNGIRWHVGFAAMALVGTVSLSPPRETRAASTPLQAVVGEPCKLPLRYSRFAQIRSANTDLLQLQTSAVSAGISMLPVHAGDTQVMSRLFGVIPWQSVDVHVEPKHMVYVGGQSIGVAIHVRGAMVVGYQPNTPHDSGLELGDVITKVNGQSITSSSALRQVVSEACRDGDMQLTVRRGNKPITLTVPYASDRSALGVYVRDRTAGIGTLTFYDPMLHVYGALGHVITDPDTGRPIDGWGRVYSSSVTGITKGEPGKPGEKKGRFRPDSAEIGDIEQNTSFGLFGHMEHKPTPQFQPREVSIAVPNQVHTGPARILTVLHGTRVESFNIEIEDVVRQSHPSTRNMVIHVTDPNLIRCTGGIVQGMSGSPILQDGRLVGAVTHVFMSDSTRGYGLFAAWMIDKAATPTKKTWVPRTTLGQIIAV